MMTMRPSRRDAIAVAGLSALGAFAGGAQAEAIAGAANVDALLAAADAYAGRFGYPDLSRFRGEYHRHVLALFVQGWIQTFLTRIACPDWVPHTGSLLPWGSPGPDTIYQYVPIDPHGLYRVSGHLGSETIAALQFRGGGPLQGQAHTTSLDEIDMTTIPAGPDRRFAFWMGGGQAKPTGAGEPWFAISPGATGMLARHVCTRPDQRDGAWSIQRLDTAPGGVIRSDADNAELLRKAIDFTLAENALILDVMKGLRDGGYVNRLKPEQWKNAGGLAAQRYAAGLFALGDGEAIVVDAVPDRASPYFSMQLFDPFNAGIDPIFHQSSLNDDSSHIDADGHVRYVIALQDPRVANWLDPGGWREAGMHWRIYKPAAFAVPDVTKVRLTDVRSVLPPSTRTVTAEDRQAARLGRIEQYQLRRRM